MSKNIIIQEGGQDRQLTAEKLKTYLVGGGSCLWVPEADVNLGTKDITENGVYKAATDGYYGYSEVTVRGIGSVTGKGQDGNDYVVKRDPTTGELVETKVPSSIRIITPPTYTGPYGKGAIISYEGMTVEALYADGSSAGELSLDQLVLWEAVPYDVPEVDWVANSDIAENVYFSNTQAVAKYYAGGEERENVWYAPSGGVILIGWSENRVTCTYAAKYKVDGIYVPYTYADKTIYLTTTSTINYAIYYYVSPTPITSGWASPSAEAAWTALYGSVSGGVQVPVQYIIPENGEVLETSFGIEIFDVTPSGTND